MNTSNFAHKAAFNATKAAYATADAATAAAKGTKLFGSSVLVGIKAGIAAAKAARTSQRGNPANPNNAVRVVAE